MMKSLRKNNKKILAIFTAMLMVAFIAQSGYQRYHAPPAGGHVVGKAGETELRSNEVEVAENEVRILLNNALVQTNSPDPAQQFVPLLQAVRMPEGVIREWLDKPVTFALLKEEARRMSVAVDPRALDLFMEQLLVRLPDRRVVPANQAGEVGQSVRASVADLMLVIEAFTRAADAVKVSRPLVMQSVVQGNQTIAVRYVPFDAKGWLAQAPQPTDEQLAAQFAKYKDLAATEFGTDANPLGVGYRYPPRVKFQSIAVPREQLKHVIKAKKDDYQWELAANKYYLQNQKEFARDDALTTTRPSTQPTTRPFAEVREQVLDKIMAPQVSALGEQVRKTIADTMRADYEAWAKVHAAPTTGPATQPTGPPASAGGLTTQPVVSSLGVPYDSYEYLEKLAAKVQQQYGVLPSTASIGEFKSEKDVTDLPGVGPVAEQAFYLAEPFVPADKKDDPAVLSLFEPSQPRAGADGADYIIRVTATDPSHAPQSLAEVRDKAVEDFKRLWAWEQAKAEAHKTLEAAKTSGGLQAVVADRAVVTAGPFGKFSFDEIKGLTYDEPASRARFTSESFKMVAQAAAASTQPAAQPGAQPATQPGADRAAPLRLIELPAQMTVLAAELASVNTNMDPENLELERLRQPLAIRQDWQNRMMPRWLSYAGVAQRLGYVDNEEAARSQQQAAAAR